MATEMHEHAPADEAASLYALRHSTAHIMAEAVTELFPDAKLAIGPPIQDGFYYDFGLSRPLTPDDLTEIEAIMCRIIREDHPFEYKVVSPDEARARFTEPSTPAARCHRRRAGVRLFHRLGRQCVGEI